MFVVRKCSETSHGEPHRDISGSDFSVWFKDRCKIRLYGLNNIIINEPFASGFRETIIWAMIVYYRNVPAMIQEHFLLA